MKLVKFAAKRDVLRMFLDGPGGSGKSEIIKGVLLYCQMDGRESRVENIHIMWETMLE